VPDRLSFPQGTVRTRVRYPETDRMGVAHHTHHLVWFELGRTELMRDLGCPYGALEDGEGIFFPVIEARAENRGPAGKDHDINVRTNQNEVPARPGRL